MDGHLPGTLLCYTLEIWRISRLPSFPMAESSWERRECLCSVKKPNWVECPFTRESEVRILVIPIWGSHPHALIRGWGCLKGFSRDLLTDTFIFSILNTGLIKTSPSYLWEKQLILLQVFSLFYDQRPPLYGHRRGKKFASLEKRKIRELYIQFH